MSSTKHDETIRVRLATEPDAMMLARFRYEFRSSFQEVVEDEAAFVERCGAWMQERLRQRSHWKCWIAECGQGPVGNVWAQLVEKIPNPIDELEHFVYVTNLYVREEHRGSGIGGSLISAAIDWSRRQSAQTIILWPTERSKTFYSRQGFSTTDDILLKEVS